MKKHPKPVHQMTEAQFEAMFPMGDDEAPKAYLGPAVGRRAFTVPAAAILRSMTCRRASGIGSAGNVRQTVIVSP